MGDYEELWNERVREVGYKYAAVNPNHSFEQDKPFIDFVEGKNAKVLDCGCGYGRLMKFFKNIWGLDCSIEMLKRNPYFPERAIYHDLTERFPFPDKFFDYSFASLVIQHFPIEDAVKVIKEMIRVTKKKIMFNLPSARNYNMEDILFVPKTEGYLITNRYYTLNGVKKLLRMSSVSKSFKIVKYMNSFYVSLDVKGDEFG